MGSLLAQGQLAQRVARAGCRVRQREGGSEEGR